MTTIESYFDKPVKSDPESMLEYYKFMVYDLPPDVIEHVKNLLLPGKTVVMFSGSWRLDLDATYLEPRMFKNSLLEFHDSTLFVEPNEQKLFDLTLSKLSPTNLLILHNDWWTAHHPIDQLIFNLDQFLKYVRPHQGQIICTLPESHVNFNKLTTTLDDLCQQTNGHMLSSNWSFLSELPAHDSLIIVRK